MNDDEAEALAMDVLARYGHLTDKRDVMMLIAYSVKASHPDSEMIKGLGDDVRAALQQIDASIQRISHNICTEYRSMKASLPPKLRSRALLAWLIVKIFNMLPIESPAILPQESQVAQLVALIVALRIADGTLEDYCNNLN